MYYQNNLWYNGSSVIQIPLQCSYREVMMAIRWSIRIFKTSYKKTHVPFSIDYIQTYLWNINVEQKWMEWFGAWNIANIDANKIFILELVHNISGKVLPSNHGWLIGILTGIVYVFVRVCVLGLNIII